MENLTVLCVCQGDYLDRSEEYVRKLKWACEQHLPEHEFFCLTDQLQSFEGINKIPMMSDLKGWWAKCELFLHSQIIPGTKVYFDLDVVITGKVDIPDPGNQLFAPDDFSYPINGKNRYQLTEEQLRWLGGPGTINSSMMVWKGDTGRCIWDDLKPECMETFHGDQNWITACLFPQDKLGFIPKSTCSSYRYDREVSSPVKVYHGTAKPHEYSLEWRAQEAA